jgi:acetate kinase
MRILTVNAGSTSIKFTEVADGEAVRQHATLEAAFDSDPPDAVAHRVVHGGERSAPELVDDRVLAALHALTDLAPLHQPPALAGIERCQARWPAVPNVACFDTAFHTTIPAAARTYALPAHLRAIVRVYGFHGLSHAWSVGTVAAIAPRARRVIVAHLGGGQSLCAAIDGRSVMTTMGFTPLDGLVMATRCGSLDPGAVLWMQRNTDDDVESVLEQESGLLGLCGSSDMRVIHRRRDSGDQDAHLALDVWRHRVVTNIGACVAALGGLDALVFTGGIGEHDDVARNAITTACGWAGVRTDDTGSTGPADAAREVTASGATVRTFVVPAREDLQLAAEAGKLLAGT